MGKLRTAWRDRRIVRGAACVTALNEREETELRAVDLHRNIRQLAYGLRLADYEGPQATGAGPRSLPKGRFVLMLGPIDPRTGCVALLKAFAEIGPDANGWHVVLAGRDGSPHRRSLEAAVYRKGGEGRVVFAAAPDLVTQRAWLARACLLAAPSLHVRFPASILQAVAAGVPVLATTPATPPGLENVVTTCGATREELREALRSVLRWSDEKRAASTDEARASGRTRLDWSLVAREYADLYTALAERS
jgi:glycosyltransferase involved in cell wall biosynthesis